MQAGRCVWRLPRLPRLANLHPHALQQNDRCPVTQRALHSLREPVACPRGYVFERADVVALLSARGGSAAHPVAGVAAQLSLSELKCARALVASALERQQTAAAPADVLVIDDKEEDGGVKATRRPRPAGGGTQNRGVATPLPFAVRAQLGMRVRRQSVSTGAVEDGTVVRIFPDGHALFRRSRAAEPRVFKQHLGLLTCCSSGLRLSATLPPKARAVPIGTVATRYRLTGDPESLVVVETLSNGVTVYVRATKKVYDEKNPGWTLNF